MGERRTGPHRSSCLPEGELAVLCCLAGLVSDWTRAQKPDPGAGTANVCPPLRLRWLSKNTSLGKRPRQEDEVCSTRRCLPARFSSAGISPVTP